MHLLVGMVDTVSSTLLQWESTIFEESVGAATIPSQYKCSQNEAGIICVPFALLVKHFKGMEVQRVEYILTRLLKNLKTILLKFQGNRFNNFMMLVPYSQFLLSLWYS